MLRKLERLSSGLCCTFAKLSPLKHVLKKLSSLCNIAGEADIYEASTQRRHLLSQTQGEESQQGGGRGSGEDQGEAVAPYSCRHNSCRPDGRALVHPHREADPVGGRPQTQVVPHYRYISCALLHRVYFLTGAVED